MALESTSFSSSSLSFLLRLIQNFKMALPYLPSDPKNSAPLSAVFLNSSSGASLFTCSLPKYSITRGFCIAFVLTFFTMFDVPVFWPILLFYWMVLFVSTMKRQIMHMVKYRYVPFSFGKQRYTGKKAVVDDDAASGRP
ncbi:Retrieval of early ER protein Rer1 [Cynara cardunculus var. scolymus]|uniref:Retrieval of early ER protein Rer1 n=1 Tax=Cynara cardunculus var. scolymus TaxID=59895 RepID=A0A124SDY0_CYNCS|nr:Retrieval of early ER protein Rer1 [Cynara cardunculus var. scolymus]